MRKTGKLIINLSFLLSTALLAGCGGGGGGNNPPAPTFSRMLGVGVIMQSRSQLSASRFGNQLAEASWKTIDLAPGIRNALPAPQIQAAAIDWEKTVTLILLVWDKISGAGRYQVFYQGEKVWDSDSVDTAADGVFQLDSPQAYLDFDQELKNPAIGQYKFTIKALSGETVIAESPTVTASLGVYLQTLPGITGFNSATLSWNKVDNATEYRIGFKDIGTATVKGATTNSYDVSQKIGSSSGKTYDVWVDARCLDAAGNPVEISRGAIHTINY